MINRAIDQLKSCCAQSPAVIPIDVLFGQLTIDVICNIAFQMDIHALKNSAMFQVIYLSNSIFGLFIANEIQELHTIMHAFFEVLEASLLY